MTASTCYIYDGAARRWTDGGKTRHELFGMDMDSVKLVVQGQPRSAYNERAAAGGCNYKYISDPLPWEAARQACVTRGGHLASIHSEYDRAIIKELVSSAQINPRASDAEWTLTVNSAAAWIGLNDREVRSQLPHYSAQPLI
jgi:hypothetical protein